MMKTALAWEEAAADTVSELERTGRLDDCTVVLVGSMARGASTEQSDVDLLVIGPSPLPSITGAPLSQIISLDRSEFLRRLEDGDDFPQWALRYGKVISDRSRWWQEILRNPAAEKWPDWKRKRDQARERLRFATPLRESGDDDHAREELLVAARHLARALLLKARVFPLSQPELPAQLREIEHPEVAELLDSLVNESAAPSALSQAEQAISAYVEKLSQ